MPIIVACPSCAGQLRIADDLVGRKVRCPACSATFDARPGPTGPAPAAAPPDGRPAPGETIDAWKSLNLELADDPPVPPPATRRSSGGEPEDPPPPPRPERPSGGRPRLNDDHDDVSPCPACGRMNHYGARRCPHCGERLTGEDEGQRPSRFRRRRDERRDTVPHRGGFLLTMGIVSLALLAFCPWVSVIPGLVAWICGQGDLRKMREGAMDPDGEGSTQAGWICGIIGTGLSVVLWLVCGSMLGLIWYEQIENSRNNNRPRFNAPPANPGPFPGPR